MTQQKPASDQSSGGTLAGALGTFIRSVMLEMEDMLPARVVSYDDQKNRAVIQPLVMMGLEDGSKVSRARVSGVPVFRFGGGGFFIRFPIKAGDFGWLKANDRDVSLIFQRGDEDWPNTDRLHSFSDAMFFPDTMRDWVIDGAFSEAVVMQSMDGSSCVAVGDGFVELRAGGQVFRLDGGGASHNGVNIGSNHRHANSGGTGTGGEPI